MDLKRPAPLQQSPSAKRHQSPQHNSHGDLVMRALIEPHLCARIMGAKGLRLRDMKRSADGNNKLNAWITPDEGFEYRVVYMSGNSATIARFMSLLVRAILDESDEPSGPDSHEYAVKLLCPHPLMGRMIGSKMAVMKTIEQESGAALSAGRNKLPDSDDRIVNIYGVADSIHIAFYHICEIFAENLPLLKYKTNEYRPSKYPLDIPPSKESTNSSANGHHERERDRGSVAPHQVSQNAPSLELSANASMALQTAFETAKDSQREQLRQIIKVPTERTNSELELLIENMKRVTSCTVKLLDPEEGAIQIEGPPEDNALAIYLAWRYSK